MIRFNARVGNGDALALHLMQTAKIAETEADTNLWLVHRDPKNADAVWLYEAYSSDEGRRRHEAGADYARARAHTETFLAGPPEVFPLVPVGGKGSSTQNPLVRFGYTVIWVPGVEKTVAFYEAAFGLQRRLVTIFGTTTWGEMETGTGTTLAFASQEEADRLFEDGYHPNRPDADPAAILISLIVPDVQATWDRAIATGAIGRDPPKTEPWGQTVARLRDINGVLVSLATPPR
jgi:uncharacterized glyoxalase superfamily protein PhnB/quinol monooxygenase YgiN